MSIMPARRLSTADPIEVWALSPSEWRISDTRVPAGDAGSVLGFAELNPNERYDVLELGTGRPDHAHGLRRYSFDTFDEVIEHFRSGIH
jgi:hypothetical protein